MGLAEPGETHELTSTGPGLAHQASAGQVPRWVRHQTDMFLPSKPRPLAGYPDPLLTLALPHPCLPVLIQTRAITGSKCIFELLDLSLQMHLQTHSIAASKYISQFTRSRPPSASLSSLNQRLQVLLRLRSSTVCSQIGRIYIYRESLIDNTCDIMM
jgi:hypothetical protein